MAIDGDEIDSRAGTGHRQRTIFPTLISLSLWAVSINIVCIHVGKERFKSNILVLHIVLIGKLVSWVKWGFSLVDKKKVFE